MTATIAAPMVILTAAAFGAGDSHGWLDPIISVLLQLAATLVLAIGTFAIRRFTASLHLKNQSQINDLLESALQKSVIYGLEQVRDQIREKGWDNIEVKSAALEHAVPYMTDRFKDTLKLAGVNVDDPAALQAAVTGALDRAFPVAANTAAMSLGTPPPTAPNPKTEAEMPPPQTVIMSPPPTTQT